jgi:hypothetical protein
MSLPSVEMGSLFLAARLARVIATTTYHRLSRCAYSIARAGMPILERAITIYDREAHAHGLHTRTGHRQMSLSSQCAECSAECRTVYAHSPAEPMRRRCLGAWCGCQRGALAVGDED